MFLCEATQTALLLIVSGKEYINDVIPKPSYFCLDSDGKEVTVEFGIDFPSKPFPKQRVLDKFTIDITDEPTVHRAGQHGSLGHYRFRLRLMNCRVVSLSPLRLKTKFYGGIHTQIARPMQRPSRALITDRLVKLRAPTIQQGVSSMYAIKFDNYWDIFYLNEKDAFSQKVDQYSSYNTGMPVSIARCK